MDFGDLSDVNAELYYYGFIGEYYVDYSLITRVLGVEVM